MSGANIEDAGMEPSPNRNSSNMTFRERLRDTFLRGGGSNSRERGGLGSRNYEGPSYSMMSNLDPEIQRYNMFLTTRNELLLFNHSPCKFHFAFNSSDFHEGLDLHLLQMMLNAQP